MVYHSMACLLYTSLCGGRRLLERHGISYHQPAAAYLCIDRAVAGLISFEEIIPPENLRVAEDFRRAGVNQLVMLTGDSDVSAQKVAQLCRMDSYHAGLLPEDKVKHVKALQQEHTVGFVGDGINDAPVLAAADLGISTVSYTHLDVYKRQAHNPSMPGSARQGPLHGSHRNKR